MNRFKLVAVIILILTASTTYAQQYSGLSGMVHIPTAEMDEQGTARVGASYLNGELLPDAYSASAKLLDNKTQRKVFGRVADNSKYNTAGFYLNITPFKWVEVSYNIVLMRRLHNTGTAGIDASTGKTVDINTDPTAERFEGDGYSEKDQFLSIKLSPIQEKEGKWWPSVAVGGCDFWDSHGGDEMYFGNVWLAVTKTLRFGNRGRQGHKHEFAFDLAYRYFFNSNNREMYGPNNPKWRWVGGLVTGFSYRPAFYHPLRFTAEWTGNEGIFGADCLLWNHLLVYASVTHRGNPTAGAAYQVNLLGLVKHKKKNKYFGVNKK